MSGAVDPGYCGCHRQRFVGFDLAVVVVGGFAVAPGDGDFQTCRACTWGWCWVSSLRLILRGGRFEDVLGKRFRKESNPLILKEWRRGWD